MNIWFQILSDAPATLQRLIARRNRISLPRGATPEIRLERLRLALCHAATVRATYFAMEKDEQAALQELRALRGGLSLEELAAQYGPVRPWAQIAKDIAPQSLSERLILHGFLLPRPAAYRHPARFLLPPEVRRWLPHPLALLDHGHAPPPPPAPVLRVATAILLACAEKGLPLRMDGQLRLDSQRLLAARLAPLDDAEVADLCHFVLPLLIDLGMLAPHGASAALSPTGARFLARPPAEQLARLRAAWVGMPRVDAWLRPLLLDTRGLDWPLLRRRLLAWAAALPLGCRLDPSMLHDALTDALGPLSDAYTHGFRMVDRVPWQPRRAAAVWDAALRGPLTWLGSIAWSTDAAHCFATPVARAEVADADDRPLTTDDRPPTTDHRPLPDDRGSTSDDLPSSIRDPQPVLGSQFSVPGWRYGALGDITISHAVLDAAVLRLLPYARWQAADAEMTTYRITPRRLTQARRDGFSIDALVTLLERQAGPLPEAWHTWLTPAPAIQIVYGAVVTSDDPAALDRAAQRRNVRRYLKRLAPGIALADPKRVESLTRALGRQDLSVERSGAPEVARPTDLSAAECATLLAACASYRQHAPDGVAPDSLAHLEERLRAALPFEQRIAAVPPTTDHRPPTTDHRPPTTDRWPLAEDRRSRIEDRRIVDQQQNTDDQAQTGDETPDTRQQTGETKTPNPEPRTRNPVRPGLLAPLLAFILALWLLLPSLWRGRTAMPKMTDHQPPTTDHKRQGTSDERPEQRESRNVQAAHPEPRTLNPEPRSLLPALHHAIERRQPLEIVYQAADGPATTRTIRPLLLENHGDCWYLRAYCTVRRDERTFRVDRITTMREVRLVRRRGRPTRQERPASAMPARRSSVVGRRSSLGASFFAPPPTPPPGSPLVRVWLAD